ncbi:MAG: 1-deoxy-D-xylulose-5-phosphate synthase N-terminal domain-containing protein, partial [Dehalococcoidia bacterium]|nr:1-deoxy-D-xylulose-5-phosphate synthase N-terminal domain-containing protein [Dehalococcoidia bacterium]
MRTILDSILHPADLKKLSYLQLEQLAVELREELIESVTSTGGHLA